MRTVLHLITSLDGGGAEHLLLDLVRAASADPRERHLVVSMLPGGDLLEEFAAAGISTRSLNLRRRMPSVSAIAALSRVIDEEGVDLLQAWMYHANLLGLAAATWAHSRPGVVWCLHAAELDPGHLSRRTRLVVRGGALLSGFPDAIVANSEATVEYHRRLGYRPGSWQLIHNGVDTSRFRPDAKAYRTVREDLKLASTTRLVGLFARWDPMKDHATFLRAAQLAGGKFPDVQFLLAGRGIEQANTDLMALVQQHAPELAGRLHLLGFRRDMPALTAALDVACITSVSGESFCLAAAEAMSCGVPCVVTDLSFLPSLVGDTGLVVRMRAPDEVSDAVMDLLGRDRTASSALGARARERVVERFSLTEMITRYRALYDLVSVHRGRLPAGARGHSAWPA